MSAEPERMQEGLNRHSSSMLTHSGQTHRSGTFVYSTGVERTSEIEGIKSVTSGIPVSPSTLLAARSSNQKAISDLEAFARY
jgi:hypothetical protein